MADPAKGKNSYIQIATQTAFDTAVAAVEKLEILPSPGLQLIPTDIPDESLYDGHSARALIDGGITCEGTLRRRANYDGGLRILRAAMGSYAASTVETGVRDHTFKEGDPGILTIEECKGNIPIGKVYRGIGLKPVRWSFEVAINQLATWEFEFLGKDLVPDFTPTPALSFPADIPVQFNQVPSGQLVDGTVDQHTTDVRVRRIRINWSRALNKEDALQIGPSLNISEPFADEMITCEWEVEQQFRTMTLFKDFLRTRQESLLDLKFQHPTTIGATSKRELHFTSFRTKLKSYTVPNDRWGVITSTATWSTMRDPTSASCLVARIRNTETALP